MQGREPIRFGTYNICNVRTRGLESKLREIYQANMDLGIFQEAKLIGGVYTSGLDGYSIVATDALSRHCGRVAVLYWPSPWYAVEAIQKFRPNVVRFQMATEERRWYIIRCYLAPDNNLTIESVVTTPKERPQGAKLQMAGDLNINMKKPEGSWRE